MAHQGTAETGYRTAPLLDFVTRAIAREEPALRAIRETTEAKGLPAISVGPDEGRLLHFLASACGARKIVEVGTLAGYSACWLAKALPEGGRSTPSSTTPSTRRWRGRTSRSRA